MIPYCCLLFLLIVIVVTLGYSSLAPSPRVLFSQVCLPTSFVFAPLSREAERLERQLAQQVVAYEALEAEAAGYARELEKEKQEALDRQARSLWGVGRSLSYNLYIYI